MVTIKENCNHAIRNKLYVFAKGEQMSNLTEKQVLEIRERVKKGETQVSVAKKFKVSSGCIGHIVYRRTWRHV